MALNLMHPYSYFLKTDLLLAFRHPVRMVEPFIFFVTVLFLFAFSHLFSSRVEAGAIVWVTALLSAVLAAHQLFHLEYEEGGIEQLVLSSVPLYGIVLTKVFGHWLITQLPLILLTPVWGIFLNLSLKELAFMSLTLFLGTPILSFVTALGSALVLGVKRGSGLIAVMMLPLLVPTLVLGVSLMEEQSAQGVQGLLALLGAYLVFTVMFFPFMISAVLRAQME